MCQAEMSLQMQMEVITLDNIRHLIMKKIAIALLLSIGIILFVLFPIIRYIACAILCIVFIGYFIILILLIILGLILLPFCLRSVEKREKEVAKYLDECDEKLKKGEMDKETNEQIHFYWECDYNG